MSDAFDGAEIKSVTIYEAGSGDSYGIEHYEVDVAGVTKIEMTKKSGPHSDIPYIRVWKGGLPFAEFCQHNIVGVYFKGVSP